MKRISVLLVMALLCLPNVQAKDYSVSSPSGKLRMQVSVAQECTWSLDVDGRTVMAANRIAFDFDGRILGDGARVRRVLRSSRSEHISAPFYRQAEFDAKYNALTLQMKDGWALEFRAYDDGVAYRLVTSFSQKQKIKEEVAQFRFCDTFDMLVPYARTSEKDRYRTSFESQYSAVKAGDTATAAEQLAFMPVYVNLGDAGSLLLMESDLWNYPGMFLRTTSDGFEAEFPPYPNNINWQDAKYLDYLTEADGTRTYPWRIIAYGKTDAELPVNNMVYQLATPSKLEDTSWITPGLSTWDWWNDFRLSGVDFECGINTESYLYHIDFAAKYGIPYVLIDDGWYKDKNIFSPIEEMDIPRICKYAASRGVKVMLWVSKGVLGLQPEKAFEHYSGLGVAGFKIDFFDSQEAAMVNRINMYAEAAAGYHLVLDFHGIYKPVGLNRTWPNVLNFEGVLGLENVKWPMPVEVDMPRNDVIIPFVRQAAGQMDYTPGAMRNASRKDFQPIGRKPMSQGTRAHQVACYVVYDSPLTMLCDSPSMYLKEDETTRFITSIPTVFGGTRILSGKAGEYVVTIRQKGDVFYVGGLTSWEGRDIDLDFGFLPEGHWICTLFADGANADKLAEDYNIGRVQVSSSDSLGIHMAPGGGFAAIITRKTLL